MDDMSNGLTYENCMSRGKAFLESKDYKAAKDAFEAAISSVPNSYEGWLALSTSLYHLKDYPRAIKACERAEAYDPLQKEFQQIQQSMNARQYEKAKGIAEDMLAACSHCPIFSKCGVPLKIKSKFLSRGYSSLLPISI